MSCACYVALPHGVMGWSAVCDCGIFRSYSLIFLTIKYNNKLNHVNGFSGC